MKRLLALIVALAAGCADARAGPDSDRIDLVARDAPVTDLCRLLSERSGRLILCNSSREERATLDLHGVTLQAALDEIAKQTGLVLTEIGPGFTPVERPERVKVALALAPRSAIVDELAGHTGERVLVAADVTGRSSLEVDSTGTSADARRVLDDFLRREKLSAVRVGELLVVSAAPLVLDVPRGLDLRRGVFVARNAPADAWFAMLEQVTGRRVEHGSATIDLGLRNVTADDVLRASVLLSRVPRPKKHLADLPPVTVLPSGRSVAWELQGRADCGQTELLLVDGRVVEEGDEVAPGVQVIGVDDGRLRLAENGVPCKLGPR